MRTLPLVLLLTPLVFASGSSGEDGVFPLPQAELRVLKGRARLVLDTEIRSVGRRSRETLGQPAHLECGPRSELELAWRGLSSLRVRGPASFGLEPDRDAPFEPYAAFLFFASADVEVRRGSLHLALSQGWDVALQRSVLQLRELPDGTIEILHQGGKPARIQSRIDRPDGWPETLSSGDRVRLPAAPRDRADD